MVAHLSPGMHDPVKPLALHGQDPESEHAVSATVIAVFTPVTPRGDVVKTTRDFDAQGAGNG